MGRCERVDRPRDMGECEVEGSPRDQLESRELVASCRAGARKQVHYMLDPGKAEKRGLHFSGLWEKLYGGRSDDAQCSFAADEELVQILAGIVLAQAPEPVPNSAVGQNHLEPQCQLAGIAVAQYRDATGIGRQIAAD